MHRGALTWLALLALAELLVVLVLVPNAWLDSVAERERQQARAVFSAASIRQMDAWAGRWYRALIRDTGIEPSLYAVAGRDASGPAPSSRGPAIDSRGIAPYLEGRVDATLLLVRQMLWRIAGVLSWAPLLVLLLVPSVIDGLTAWRIRRHGFRYASPLAHRYAWRMQGMVLVALLFALALPVPLPPLVMPMALGLIAVCVAVGLAHLPKRI
jgi:hypothetical protein